MIRAGEIARSVHLRLYILSNLTCLDLIVICFYGALYVAACSRLATCESGNQ